MSFELIKNPFEKSMNSSAKFETLRDRLEDQGTKRGLQYPVDLGQRDQQNFILFTVYDVNPGSFSSSDTVNKRQATVSGKAQDFTAGASGLLASGAKALSSLGLGGLGGFADKMQKVSNFYKDQLESDPLETARKKQASLSKQSVTSQTRFSNKTKKTEYSIALYMPNSIQTELSANYNMEDMGMLQGLAKAGGAAGDVIKSMFSGQAMSDEQSAAAAGTLKDAVAQAGVKVGLEAVDAVAGVAGIDVNSAAAAKAMRRKVVNPHMEFLFESVGQRSYSFSFKMVPRNLNETKQIHDIIRIFRSAALPSSQKGGGLTLDFPAEFDISYFRGGSENTWIPRISRCALTNVSVNFTPNGKFQTLAEQSFDDVTGYSVEGAPPASVELALSFSEMSTLLREDVVEGGF